ncbi:MAG: nuclear transport factor 2 family protein [Rhodobacteraceae bacterium]|nr:nuclear transport factor 2 family protein [Paracoccaceae bacterium]
MGDSASDDVAIRGLIAAYADAVNTRNAERMAAVLAPDGIIEKPGHGEPVQGREKILKRYTRLQRERSFLCQMIHSSVVQVEGDRACARSWFSEIKQVTETGQWLAIIGVYQDELVRRPEGWRFARRMQTTILERQIDEAGIASQPLPDFLPFSGVPTL